MSLIETEIQSEYMLGWQTSEYALSIERLRTVGGFAVARSIDIPEEIQILPEGMADVNQLRAEFDTSLAEMLKSDDILGQNRQITRFDEQEVINGYVLALDGKTTMQTMLDNGRKTSARLAKTDDRMKTQNIRDEHDYDNLFDVEKMIAGERPYNTKIVASLLPQEAVDRDGVEHWQSMGYFIPTKTAFLQMYHVNKEGKLITGTLTVDMADKTSMRKLWEKIGVIVPTNESSDNWLKYAFTGTMTEEASKEFVKSLREKHNALTGHAPEEVESIENRISDNKDIVDQAFNELQLSLALATKTKLKTPTIQNLLERFSSYSLQLKPELRNGLIRALNKESFDNQDVRLAYKLIMYSTVEMIRDRKNDNVISLLKPSPHMVYNQLHELLTDHIYAYEFIQRSVLAGINGINQQRVYIACNFEFNFNGDPKDGLPLPQGVFGGNAKQDAEILKPTEDVYGPLEFTCKNGHLNKRPWMKLLDECTTCRCSVKC